MVKKTKPIKKYKEQLQIVKIGIVAGALNFAVIVYICILLNL